MATIEADLQTATADLSDVLQDLKSQESGEHPTRLAKLKALGDRSREYDNRLEFLRSGLLEYLLERLDPSQAEEDTLQILRVVGNCCADLDDVREYVLPHIGGIITCLEYENLLLHAILSIFNLCNDYEPAQKAIARLDALLRLEMILAKGAISPQDPGFTPTIEVLHWAAINLDVAHLTQDECIATFRTSIGLASRCDTSDYDVISAICLRFLKEQPFQSAVLDRQLLDLALDLFEINNKRIQEARDDEDEEDQQTFSMNEVSLINHLTDIASQEQFPSSVPLDSPRASRLRDWFETGADAMRTCSCLMLGNLAVTDESCIYLVERLQMHLSLIRQLDKGDNSLRFAAAGFLRHLAIPSANKPVLVDSGVIDSAINGVALLDQELVACAGVQLLRQIILDSYDNAERLFRHPRIQDVLSQVSRPRVGAELGRLVVSLCRAVQSTSTSDVERSGEDTTINLDHIVTRPHTVEAVVLLVRQDNLQLLTEGWFGLALIAKSATGASRLLEALRESKAFNKLMEPLVPRADESAAQQNIPSAILEKTKENARFTAAQLLSHQETLLEDDERETVKSALRDSIA